jgi:hypothetical protein
LTESNSGHYAQLAGTFGPVTSRGKSRGARLTGSILEMAGYNFRSGCVGDLFR